MYKRQAYKLYQALEGRPDALPYLFQSARLLLALEMHALRRVAVASEVLTNAALQWASTSPDDAQQAAERALALDAKHPAAQVALGLAHQHQEDWVAALEHLERGLRQPLQAGHFFVDLASLRLVGRMALADTLVALGPVSYTHLTLPTILRV